MTPHVPVANGMLPFWRTDPHPLDNYRSSETLPEHSDIVIVGAGYAGSSVAHHILQQVKPGSSAPSITILEARQACSGATARNGRGTYILSGMEMHINFQSSRRAYETGSL